MVDDRKDCACGSPHGRSDCSLLARAARLLGAGATIGVNAQHPLAPLYVAKVERGRYVSFGAGTDWEEAFANVKKVVRQKGNGAFIFEGDEKARR